MEAVEDLVSVIITDHRQFERVFRELETGQGALGHRRGLAEHVITALVRHAVAEEQLVCPVARRALAGGDEIADHKISEHSEVEQLLKRLDGVHPEDPRFDALIGQVVSSVRSHIEEEESDLLPRLQGACTAEELHDLGQRFTRAKRCAPTRPHPTSANLPPARRILDPGAGLVDRMRVRLDRVQSGSRAR